MPKHTIEEARRIMSEVLDGKQSFDAFSKYVKLAPKKVLLELLNVALTYAYEYKKEADKWFTAFARK